MAINNKPHDTSVTDSFLIKWILLLSDEFLIGFENMANAQRGYNNT